MTGDNCLDEGTLRQYLAARLPNSASDDVERHLEDCPSCQSLLVALSDSEDSLLAAVRGLPSGDSLEDEPELAKALEAIAVPPAAPPPGQGEAPIEPAGEGFPDSAFIRDYQLVQKLGEGGMGTVYLAVPLEAAKDGGPEAGQARPQAGLEGHLSIQARDAGGRAS